ncbi:MAG: GNAT family N-acetyltransferase [Candidatus Lokiarchaeota archaeon]|nr:GNAT family N-acetyltransferase [Candidatus Lokiarchaeota archaeon]
MSSEEIKKEDIIIRNYRTSDYQATLEILKELNDELDIGFEEKQWRESSGLRQFKPNLKRITLIAELKSNGEVMSMGMIEAVKNTIGRYIGRLDNWATKKEYIGAGVGKLLAERSIQILQSWGCDSIRINLAYGTDEKLLQVFAKTGFHPIITVLEKRF